jgi:pSer/pThr/pTyr-binding forkhead associated (FHA) protein
MAATLRLTVMTGPHKGTKFCMRRENGCMVGRGAECHMRFCGENRDLHISRCHCQLYFDPPWVRIQDMDSGNGAYVNGRRIGLAEPGGGGPKVGLAQDGDILTIGGTSLSVNIVDCPEDFTLGPKNMSIRAQCPTATC